MTAIESGIQTQIRDLKAEPISRICYDGLNAGHDVQGVRRNSSKL